jgi:predicted HD phosphohydrolase
MRSNDRLPAICSEAVAQAYLGDAVATVEHSLQTAHFARPANASDAPILAALLHDVGHLIEFASPDLNDWGKRFSKRAKLC